MKTFLFALHVIEYWKMEYPGYNIGENIEQVYEKRTIRGIIKCCSEYNKTVPDCCGKIYESCFGSGNLSISADDDHWFV